jgi:hypothetical protein
MKFKIEEKKKQELKKKLPLAIIIQYIHFFVQQL